jgi:hypothetical protein
MKPDLIIIAEALGISTRLADYASLVEIRRARDALKRARRHSSRVSYLGNGAFGLTEAMESINRGTIPKRLVGDAASIPELRAMLKRFNLALLAEVRRRAPNGETIRLSQRDQLVKTRKESG